MEFWVVFRIFVLFGKPQLFHTEIKVVSRFKKVKNKFDDFVIFHQIF